SFSVTVVRSGCLVGRALNSAMLLTFRFNDSASSRDGPAPAPSPVDPASTIATSAVKALRDMNFQNHRGEIVLRSRLKMNEEITAGGSARLRLAAAPGVGTIVRAIVLAGPGDE